MPNPTYKYSNGIDTAIAVPAMVGRLKWLSDIATPSKSGRYFDDLSFHSLVDEKLFRSVQNNAAISDVDFAALKVVLEKAAIQKALTAVFNDQHVIEQTLLYEVVESRMIAALPAGDFVGYALDVPASLDHALKIVNAVFHFDTSTTFKLYVYEDGCTTPFWEESVTLTGGKYSIVPLTDCFISFRRSKTARFYIGYKPSEVTGGSKPYTNESYCPLQSCMFDANAITASLPITRASLQYASEVSGLNLEIQSFNDFTTLVQSSPSQFDELVGLITASIVIEQILYSQRKTGEQRTAVDSAERFAMQLDLTGTLPVSDAPQIMGLRNKIALEVRRVQKSFINKKTGVISYAS